MCQALEIYDGINCFKEQYLKKTFKQCYFLLILTILRLVVALEFMFIQNCKVSTFTFPLSIISRPFRWSNWHIGTRKEEDKQLDCHFSHLKKGIKMPKGTLPRNLNIRFFCLPFHLWIRTTKESNVAAVAVHAALNFCFSLCRNTWNIWCS